MCDLGYPLSNRYVTQEQVAVVLFVAVTGGFHNLAEVFEVAPVRSAQRTFAGCL